MKPAIPGREHEVVTGYEESSGEMQRVEAAEPPLDSKRGGVLDERLVDLDGPECGPLVRYGLGRPEPCHEADGTDRLDEARPADEPALGSLHGVEHDITSGLGHVALDQRARVEVEVQLSASRSERTNADALPRALAGLGACLGRARAGRTTRP